MAATQFFNHARLYQDAGKPVSLVANDGDVKLRFIVINNRANVIGVKRDGLHGPCPLLISVPQGDPMAQIVAEIFTVCGYKFDDKPFKSYPHTIDRNCRDVAILKEHFGDTIFEEFAPELLKEPVSDPGESNTLMSRAEKLKAIQQMRGQ